MGNTQLIVDNPHSGWKENVDPQQIDELLGDHTNLIWLDVTDPGPTDLELLRREFGFHELAIEDVASAHQRPKCDTYRDYYFIVVYAAEHTATAFAPRELAIFWGANYVITLHQGDLQLIGEARKRWANYDDRERQGTAYVIYTLLDCLVDEIQPLADWLSERVEDVEEDIFGRGRHEVTNELFQLRKELLRMRRVLAPTRDVVNEIIRRDLPLYHESLRPYFSDVYDHILRALDGIEVYRDLLASALDVYLSQVSNRLNQLVKRMTALMLIVMVPTLIAGIYGMNFKEPFPSYDWDLGFWYSIGVMGVLMLGGLVLAKRADWI
jgi:magnesium transporter